jgi:putative phosphoribosyl transferase
MNNSVAPTFEERLVHVPAGPVTLDGNLTLSEESLAIVLFAHGSGSSRHSPRNRYVARLLNDAKLATLLIDLLTLHEEVIDARTAQLRFDIGLLAERLVDATDWLTQFPDTKYLPIGYFGASTGAAAALAAAAIRPDEVGAVVSRGGRPDLAGAALIHVQAPTLLIVGENDDQVIQLNREALAQMRCEKQLAIVPGATHLFEKPGALDEVSRFGMRLVPASSDRGGASHRDLVRGRGGFQLRDGWSLSGAGTHDRVGNLLQIGCGQLEGRGTDPALDLLG